MNVPLTILYTQNLHGDVALLPPLYTFLRLLREQAQRFEDDEDVLVCALQPPARRVLLVDVGESCAPGVWHCDVTGGRSTLIVLDAMGYDAAHADLTPENRDRLDGSVQMALVDATHDYLSEGVAVVAPGREAALDPRPALAMVFDAQTRPRVETGVFYPARLIGGQVGVAHVAFRDGAARLSGHDVFTLPPNTRHDATIAGAVDFVLGEARYYQKQQSSR